VSVFEQENSAARNFMLSAIFWLAFAITLGPTMATQFLVPDLFRGISWLSFPHLRMDHTNLLLFGWISMAMIGGWLYIVPRLVGRRLYSEPLGNATMALWNLVMVGALVTLALGQTQGREYAEMIWPLDIGVMLGLLAIGFNVFKTIFARTEEKLYVSVWYVMGTLIWFPIVYAVGNVIWNPPSGALTGLNDAIWGWFYGHNVLGLWFTTGVLALLYFVIPLVVGRPVYGHKLSLIAFWMLAFFYTAVGAHHILQSPVPEWLKTIAVVSSIGLLIPVFTFLTNIWMTMRGEWRKQSESVALRFAVTSAVWYLLVCIQGPLQALRGVNVFVHFSNWTVAHAHLALTAFASYGGFAIIYFAIPRITKRKLYSTKLAWAHWWLATIGIAGFVIDLTAAGLVQSSQWMQGQHIIAILTGLIPYFILRATFGTMIATGAYLFAYNIFRTVTGPVVAEDDLPVYPPVPRDTATKLHEPMPEAAEAAS
jgi:cbb3-type cytochrome c oxidase subunit I